MSRGRRRSSDEARDTGCRKSQAQTAECSGLCVFCRARLSAIPWTVAHQAPLSMGFPRQEYRSGLPCPLPGDLSHPGIESVTRPTSPALADRFFTTSAAWAALDQEYQNIKLNKSLLIWRHALGIQGLLSRKHPRDVSNVLLECS